jgi:hypothetical protein
MTQPHIHRKGPGIKRHFQGVPTDYPAGYFTKPVLAWFGPHWLPSIDWKATINTATDNRQRGLDAGAFWAVGTLPGMAGTPKDSRPLGWMGVSVDA